MRVVVLFVAILLLPALAAPAVGDVHVEDVPDRVVMLVMRGHTFNGLSYPDTPLLEAFVGEKVQVTVLVPAAAAEAHTFHMHGHPWLVPSQGRVVDTVLLKPGDAHSFTVTAGGAGLHPGDWMYHCHFDDHVAGGMWGVFRVYPYATHVTPVPTGLLVSTDRLGVPLDGADLSVTLDGEPVPAHVAPLGGGRYHVHTGLPPDAKGVLVVRAHHALGDSVARAGLGGVPVPTPTIADESDLPREALGHARHG